MINEGHTGSTEFAKPTRKIRYLWRLVVLFTALFISLAIYSLRKYAEILVSTPSAIINSKADCAVVLTGAPGRVREGITLLSHKQVKKLIISGVHQYSTLSEMFPEILFYPEIELENVILERRSSSTAGNAQQSLIIVEALQCQSVLLVTSDFHMHRTLNTFTQIFPATLTIKPYPLQSDRMRKRAKLWFDTRFWSTVFDEWLKCIFYLIFVY
ncbi:MAG: YdcF family protein [Oligoflexia bacterium]|nr:YdcF family protein [Oligoflexia bacterium]